MNKTDIEKHVRQFIADNFLFRDDRAAIAAGESLLEAGLIDSTGILELVAFIETDFGIVVADEDIVPENLDTIGAIVAYIAARAAPEASAA